MSCHDTQAGLRSKSQTPQSQYITQQKVFSFIRVNIGHACPSVVYCVACRPKHTL
jgi:hypothetical protein